jgi:hypothetical protein
MPKTKKGKHKSKKPIEPDEAQEQPDLSEKPGL